LTCKTLSSASTLPKVSSGATPKARHAPFHISEQPALRRSGKSCPPYSAGPASAWHKLHIAHEDLSAVSCSSKSLCVAIDRADKVLVSTDPAARHPMYKATTIDKPLGSLSPPDSLSSVRCAANGTCYVGDIYGNLVVGRKR